LKLADPLKGNRSVYSIKARSGCRCWMPTGPNGDRSNTSNL